MGLPASIHSPARKVGAREFYMKTKKSAPAGKKPAVKKSKKAKAARSAKLDKLQQNQTFMRLSRGMRKGGAQITRYGKKAISGFTSFTNGEDDSTIVSFFRKHSGFMSSWRFSGFILATIVLVIVMVIAFNNSSIVVDQTTISVAGLSGDFEGYRILLISDLSARQFGEGQVSLMRTINALSYDMMICCGDMVGADGNAQPFYEIIDNKTSGAPVYFVAGDSDPGPLLSEPREASGEVENFVLADWIIGARDRGAIYLDAPIKITKGKSTMWLTPEPMLDIVASPLLSRFNAEYRAESESFIGGSEAARIALPFTAYRVKKAQVLLDTVNRMTVNDLHIAVGHFPPTESYNTTAANSDSGMLRTPDLVLCGHYCGGGIRLPLFGALYVPAVEAPRHGWFPDQSVVEGERLLGNVTVYTTGGLSVSESMGAIKMRLNNQPKVTLLTLTAALTGDLLGR